MDRCARPGLSCVLVIAAAVAAPACLAQQAPTPPAETAKDGAAVAVDAQPATTQPRSAFGKVMSLMIAALQQNADKPATVQQDQSHPAAARDIQVSAAFRLAPPTAPATASID